MHCSIGASAQEIANSVVNNVGSSCFKEPAWPNDSVNRCLCVFALNAVSPYFEQEKRVQVIKRFVKSQNHKCNVSEGVEMTDSKANVDHIMFLIVYHVTCDKGSI